MFLTLVAEDESDNWQMCCGTLHTFVAFIIFVVFDFAVILIGTILYGFLVNAGADWSNIIPLLVFATSAIWFSLAPLGVVKENKTYIGIYLLRLVLMTIFSLVFSVTCIFAESDEGAGFWAIIVWFLFVFPYSIGVYISAQSIDFLTNVYRGYDFGVPSGRPLQSMAALAETAPATATKSPRVSGAIETIQPTFSKEMDKATTANTVKVLPAQVASR